MHLIDRRAHTNAEPHFILYVWLRIRVAFGVFSGLPVPTDDPLASLHVVAHTWTAQPNPAWLPGGGLIGKLGFDALLPKSFTPFALAARYGSNESAGPRLPANVSRNTPATEAGRV
jgi:hypothetical protein